MTAPASTDDIKVLQHFLDLTNQYLAKLQRLTGDDEVTDASVKSFAGGGWPGHRCRSALAELKARRKHHGASR